MQYIAHCVTSASSLATLICGIEKFSLVLIWILRGDPHSLAVIRMNSSAVFGWSSRTTISPVLDNELDDFSWSSEMVDAKTYGTPDLNIKEYTKQELDLTSSSSLSTFEKQQYYSYYHHNNLGKAWSTTFRKPLICILRTSCLQPSLPPRLQVP
jgi:hypothetical protein